jgi:hypothetical protein
MIKVNLRDDWKEFLERAMTVYGIEYDPSQSLERNTGSTWTSY